MRATREFERNEIYITIKHRGQSSRGMHHVDNHLMYITAGTHEQERATVRILDVCNKAEYCFHKSPLSTRTSNYVVDEDNAAVCSAKRVNSKITPMAPSVQVAALLDSRVCVLCRYTTTVSFFFVKCRTEKANVDDKRTETQSEIT